MLTQQQKTFAEELIKRRCKHGAAKEAAIAAGYSKKTAASIAHNLLKRDDVQKYIQERKNSLADELRDEFLFDAIEARQVMNDILNNKGSEDRDRLKVAIDFLDRAGFSAPKTAETEKQKDDDNEEGGVIVLAEVRDSE